MSKDPLHGITLKMILTELVAHYGWKKMGEQIEIGCFVREPSITSSLRFLRKTPWARTKVENFYVRLVRRKERLKQKDASRKETDKKGDG